MDENSPGKGSEGDVWLIVPTYDEAENIEAVVAAATTHLPADHTILIVDDNSPDGTGAIADRIAAADPRVRVLHRKVKEGLGPAYIAGFREALGGGAEFVIEMDCDFSHDPADLPRLLSAARDADLVIGSRYVPGGGVAEWGPLRRAISKGGSIYARAVLGVGVRDLTGGFKCLRRTTLETIGLETIDSKGYAFQIETNYRAIRAGLRVVEVPIHFHDRRVGSSKMSKAIFAEAIWRVPAMRIAAHSQADPARRRTERRRR